MKAAAYARFSSDNQRQESIDAQIRAIKAYCDKNDHDLVHIYQDEAVSATSDQREQFLKMIEQAKDGFFDCVIVHKLDRFARNRYDSAFYKRQLRQSNVRIISVLEQLDDSPESVILESVLEGMAEYYSMNLAREVRKGMNENALQALHNGGLPPLGFTVNQNKTYSINDAEADTVRLIFQMYADGFGYKMIVNELNEKGHRTKKGNMFGKNSIFDLLRNEKYIGRYVFNLRESKKAGNRKHKPDAAVTRIDNAMPRIISDELWDKVQTKLEGGKKPRMNATRVYLLTGKLVCGKCGAAYVGDSYFLGRDRVTKYFSYGCCSRQRKGDCENKNIRADLLEDYVLELIKDKVLNIQAIELLAGMIMDIVQDALSINKELMADLYKKRDSLKIQTDKLFDLYLDDLLDKNTVAEKTNKMKVEIENYESRIRLLNFTAFDDLEYAGIKSYMLDLRTKLNDADSTVKKIIIESLVDEIVINEEAINIVLKVDPLHKRKKANPELTELTQAKVGGGEEN